MLTNGTEVKIQRNALSVIEVPNGDEDDDWEDLSSGGSDLGSRNTPQRRLVLIYLLPPTFFIGKVWSFILSFSVLVTVASHLFRMNFQFQIQIESN